MRFYPYYLELIESNEYFHHIKFKRTIFKNINLNDEIVSNYNNYEFPLCHLLHNKDQLLRRCKFISILKFLNRFQDKLDKRLNKAIEGVINTNRGRSNISINFINNLKGNYNLTYQEDHISYYGGHVISGSVFKSLYDPEFLNYYLEFKLIKIQEQSKHGASLEEIRVNGEFFILMIDLMGA